MNEGAELNLSRSPQNVELQTPACEPKTTGLNCKIKSSLRQSLSTEILSKKASSQGRMTSTSGAKRDTAIKKPAGAVARLALQNHLIFAKNLNRSNADATCPIEGDPESEEGEGSRDANAAPTEEGGLEGNVNKPNSQSTLASAAIAPTPFQHEHDNYDCKDQSMGKVNSGKTTKT